MKIIIEESELVHIIRKHLKQKRGIVVDDNDIVIMDTHNAFGDVTSTYISINLVED